MTHQEPKRGGRTAHMPVMFLGSQFRDSGSSESRGVKVLFGFWARDETLQSLLHLKRAACRGNVAVGEVKGG